MRALYYDPQVGRFASEDSAKDGLNWFAYCANDPVNHVDSTGKAAELVLPTWLVAFMAGFMQEFFAYLFTREFDIVHAFAKAALSTAIELGVEWALKNYGLEGAEGTAAKIGQLFKNIGIGSAGGLVAGIGAVVAFYCGRCVLEMTIDIIEDTAKGYPASAGKPAPGLF